MEELDLLRKSWNDGKGFNQVSENEIYGMLHKRSSSVVKWILVISILEVALWTLLGFALHTDDYINELQMDCSQVLFGSLNVLSYVVIFVFILLFYRNYRRISTTASTRSLMAAILRARKTVQYYVYYNLVMVVVGLFLGVFLFYNYNPKMDDLKEKLSDGQHGMLVFICLCVIFGFAALAVFLFWLFYRLAYGILLRKLLKNYNDLKKIDLE